MNPLEKYIEEKDIETKLREMVKRNGGRCLKWVCPGWAGVPDRMLLLPGGRVYFVETKRPKGGVLSARQKWWRRELQRLGFWYAVAWTVADIQTLELVIRDELARFRGDGYKAHIYITDERTDLYEDPTGECGQPLEHGYPSNV